MCRKFQEREHLAKDKLDDMRLVSNFRFKWWFQKVCDLPYFKEERFLFEVIMGTIIQIPLILGVLWLGDSILLICFRLTNGTLHGLQQAETVDLSRNRLTSIGSGTFTGFHHLKDLNLSHNRIRVLRGGSFRGCLTVQTLKMSGSGVRIIQPNAFDDLVSIAELDLRYGH